MQDIIIKILDISRYAPSGDNVQPWNFIIEKDILYILNVPKKDLSLYNTKQIASFVAHGCLIENIIISSKAFGLTAKVELNEEAGSDLIAKISFISQDVQKDSLFDFIQYRSTNRKAYGRNKLSENEKRIIYAEVHKIGSEGIAILDDAKEMEEVATAASMNEKIVLENFHLHEFLFRHVIWSPKEQRKEGMPIETFELLSLQKFIFKLCSKWRIQRLLNKIGISRLVASENKKIYRSSAAFIAFTIERKKKKDLILLGMLLQRVWLRATELDLNMQLMAGITLLAENLLENDNKFSVAEKNIIVKAKKIIQTAFNTAQNIIIVARIGRGEKASKRTPRLELSDLIVTK